jgi:hypothetical protein
MLCWQIIFLLDLSLCSVLFILYNFSTSFDTYVCMCVCMYVCRYYVLCTYICMNVCIDIYLCIFIYACTYVCTYVCMCTFVSVDMQTFFYVFIQRIRISEIRLCKHEYISVCVLLCVRLCIYMYMWLVVYLYVCILRCNHRYMNYLYVIYTYFMQVR